MSDVSNLLKSKRKDLGLSVKYVVEQLSLNGIDISDKTFYGWESGHRQPDADTFLALCRIYGINSFPDVCLQSNNPFSDLEKELIKKYRTLDEYGKEAVSAIIDIEYHRVESERASTQLTVVKQVARNGDYIEEFLTDSEKNRRIEELKSLSPVDDL